MELKEKTYKSLKYYAYLDITKTIISSKSKKRYSSLPLECQFKISNQNFFAKNFQREGNAASSIPS